VVRKEERGFTISDLILLRKEVPAIKLILNLHSSSLSGARFLDVYKKEGTLGGLVKNFDIVLLSGTNKKREEVLPTTNGDAFSLYDYKGFLSQFKNALIVYRGELGSVLELHEKLKDGQ